MKSADRDCKATLGPIEFHHCKYDEEDDVLYLSVSAPQPAITWESPEGALVRLDPETREVIGLTILDASEVLENGEMDITVPEPDERRQLGLRIPRSHQELRIGRGLLAACV